jgi:hypothetical protein
MMSVGLVGSGISHTHAKNILIALLKDYPFSGMSSAASREHVQKQGTSIMMVTRNIQRKVWEFIHQRVLGDGGDDGRGGKET